MTAQATWPVARLRRIGSAGWILAAVLTVAGSFMPLMELTDMVIADKQVDARMGYSLWGTGGDDNDPFSLIGVPVVLGAVLLAVAGLLGLTSTRQHPASGPVLAARLIGTGGTGLLAGSLAAVLIQLRVFARFDDMGPFRTTTGFGTWLLLAAGVLAVAAIVLLLVPSLAKRGAEPETPAMGLPVVRVLEPEYDDEDAAGLPRPAGDADPKG